MSFHTTMLFAIAAAIGLLLDLSVSIAVPLAPTPISSENEMTQMQHRQSPGHGLDHIFIQHVAMAALTTN
jgi:hypothetical protein